LHLHYDLDDIAEENAFIVLPSPSWR